MSCNNSRYRFSEAWGELRGRAITLHRQRYREIGFMPEGFQDPYEKDSIYFAARSPEREDVLGVCRLVMQRLETLATYANFELFEPERRALHQLAPGSYTELGALTKVPRHPDLVPGLLTAAFAHASRRGITHLLCCIDERLFGTVTRFLGLPLRVIGKAQPFYGSTKIPCVTLVPECLEQLRRRVPPDLGQLPPPPAAREQALRMNEAA